MSTGESAVGRSGASMAGSGGYLRNLIAQTGARVLFIGATLVTFIAIARLLGPGPFGQYSYAVTFATLFATLADFGTGSILGKELAERRGRDDRAFFGAFILLRLASSLALVLPALVLAYVLKPELLALLALACVAIPILSFRFFEPIYQVYERPWDAVPPAVAGSIVYFGTTLTVLWAGGGVLPLLAGYVAGNAVYAFVAFGLSRRGLRPILRWDDARVRGILRLALPIGVSTVFTSFNSRVGTLLLGEMSTDHAVGIYNAAFRFLDFAAMGGVLLMTPLVPIFSQQAILDRPGLARGYASLVEHLAVLAVPAALSLPILSPVVIRLCFGAEFAESAPVLNVLGLSAGLVFFSLASSAANVSMGVVRHGYWVGALALGVNLTLSFVLIPTYGPLGAAYGALAAEISMLAVSQYYTSGALGSVFRPSRWALLLALGGSLWLFIHAGPFAEEIRLPLGLVAYGVAAWSLGLVEPALVLRRDVRPAGA